MTSTTPEQELNVEALAQLDAVVLARPDVQLNGGRYVMYPKTLLALIQQVSDQRVRERDQQILTCLRSDRDIDHLEDYLSHKERATGLHHDS